MSTWHGISHGRTTRAMERSLLPAEFKVVATLRRLIPDGQRRRLPQALIAQRAKVSEGTVSRTMRKVEGIFFRRHFLGKGRGGGYEIEALPPAEQLQLPPSAPDKGSLTDPSLETFGHGVAAQQTPAEKGSVRDPSTFLHHAHEQQQQNGASIQEDGREDSGQLAPETVAALEAANAHPKVIARIAAANPGCTPADVAAALAAAQLKPNAHTPPGLALEALARHQAVVPPREQAPAAEPKPPRPRGRNVKPDELLDPAATRAWLAAQGLPVNPAPGEASPERPEPRPPVKPYYGPEAPPERVATPQPPPISPRPLIQRPPPGERRLGPLHELGRERQRELLKRGGRR